MTMVIEGISQDVSGKLFAVLKNWSGDYMDAFRYECFARRLIAAEHGRPDAVEWAMNWYNDVVAEERQAEGDRQRATKENEERKAAARAELRAGRCGNPNYQAFLDTLEHPEQIENNAPYFAWISELRGRFEGTSGVADMAGDEKAALWQKMIREKRDANLAPRMKGRSLPDA
jgi:hypothetical protein